MRSRHRARHASSVDTTLGRGLSLARACIVVSVVSTVRSAPGGLIMCAALCGVLLTWLAPSAVSADAFDQPEHVVVRHDTILNYAPRYELRIDDAAASSAARFWHRVQQLPLYDRVTLDADGLAHGALDVHIMAWGAGDLTLPADRQLASGDFAVAYARAKVLEPISVWGGRRFLTWGLPGGLHLDGIGIEQRSAMGLHFEAIAGRPVGSVFTPIGAHSEYVEPTVAYGARLGYERPGQLAAGVSFLERWGHGIATNRTVMATVAYRSSDRLDMLATSTFDMGAGLEEARAQVAYLVSDAIEPDLGIVHADPQKLLPSWSILSMFAADVYDEGVLGVTMRLSRAVSTRLELAGRRAYLPGGQHDDVHFGHRADAILRYVPVPKEAEFIVELSRRDEATTTLDVGRVGASFRAYRRLRIAPEVGAAIDENAQKRTALLVRGSAELPFGSRWSSVLTVDLARTPVALAEVRSMLRVSYRFDSGGP